MLKGKLKKGSIFRERPFKAINRQKFNFNEIIYFSSKKNWALMLCCPPVLTFISWFSNFSLVAWRRKSKKEEKCCGRKEKSETAPKIAQFCSERKWQFYYSLVMISLLWHRDIFMKINKTFLFSFSFGPLMLRARRNISTLYS